MTLSPRPCAPAVCRSLWHCGTMEPAQLRSEMINWVAISRRATCWTSAIAKSGLSRDRLCQQLSGRLAGYRQAMAEAGVTEDPHYIVPSTFSIESGETAAHHLLTLASPPTAIFAINDNTAIGSMSAIAKAGLSVPGDISLVGYNDIPIVSRLPPVPLTTVRVPFDRIAEVALQILFEDGADHTIRLATPPSLIPRKSTAPLT